MFAQIMKFLGLHPDKCSGKLPPVEKWPDPPKTFKQICEDYLEKLYFKHIEDHIKRYHPNFDIDKAIVELGDQISEYIDNTIDDFADIVSVNKDWLSSDIDDLADGIFEPHITPKPEDEYWHSEDEANEQNENVNSSQSSITKKQEILRDWNNDW